MAGCWGWARAASSVPRGGQSGAPEMLQGWGSIPSSGPQRGFSPFLQGEGPIPAPHPWFSPVSLQTCTTSCLHQLCATN